VLLDVPHAPLEQGDGVVHVSGWGERGGVNDASHPAGELPELVARFGAYPTSLNREAAGRPVLSRTQLRTLRRMAPVRAQVLLDLMSRHPWELVVAAFHEVHYAGHAFHIYTDPEPYRRLGHRPRLVRELEHALLRCYQDADRALGALLAAAPAGTHTAVFSGMGLRPATSGPLLIERALVALGYQVPALVSPGTRHRQVARAVALKAIPRPLARALKRRLLDGAAIDAQLERAAYESTDWPATSAWGEGEPGFGYVRFNVRGREPAGLVDAADVADLRERVTADLLALRSVDGDEPVVDAVVPIEEIVGPDPHPALPDLVVRLSTSTMALRARHPRAGVIDGGSDGYRLTEHDGDGWIVLHGPKVEPGSDAGNARVEDVAPTLVHLMDGSQSDAYEGRVLDELLVPTTTALPRSSAPRG
jgi:predicted AlkP superfamily phosphohydrolase/phosphomutase